MIRCTIAKVELFLCLFLCVIAVEEEEINLQHRIKACEFIQKKMMPTHQQTNSANNFFGQGAAGPSNWSPYQASPGFVNQPQQYFSTPSLSRNTSPNLAIIYGGELLRGLRSLIGAEIGHVEEPEPKNRWQKALKKVKKVVQKPDVDKLLIKQDTCLQKLATGASEENNELIIKLTIEYNQIQELKNIIEHGGGFIKRIIYFGDEKLSVINDHKFFEQLFYDIMNLKNTVYQMENVELAGIYQMQMFGNANYAMMQQQQNMMANNGMVPNYGETMGNTMAFYGMAVGNKLGNWMGNAMEFGKRMVEKMNNDNNAVGFIGNNQPPFANNNMMNGMPGMENTTIYTMQTPSIMIEDIAISIQGIEEWPKKLLVKLLEDQVFEGMRYIKGDGGLNGGNRIPYWEAMLGLSPITKSVLQFCKSSSPFGRGLKFRTRIKRLPTTKWQHFTASIAELTGKEQICF